MTVRMTAAAAADQVFLVSDQDSPTRQLLLSAQKLKTCFFFLYLSNGNKNLEKSSLSRGVCSVCVFRLSLCSCVLGALRQNIL